MTRAALRERLKQGLFLLDGAMGTQLIARGIEAGVCNDYLNIEKPGIVLDIHKAYLNAGSDAVITNTFGANRITLSRHGLGERAADINRAGARLARRASGEDKYVLGDIGPSGDFLEPLGNIKPRQLKEVFLEQAAALVEGGVDGLIVETMTALEELQIAIEAAKEFAGNLPVFASMAFEKKGDDFRTMMGIGVGQAVETMISAGADVAGFNCGSATLDEYVKLAEALVAVVKREGKDIPVFAEPNAGRPQLLDGKTVYKVSPDEFAEACKKMQALGINIIGGCCGTGPEHIRELAERRRT